MSSRGFIKIKNKNKTVRSKTPKQPTPPPTPRLRGVLARADTRKTQSTPTTNPPPRTATPISRAPKGLRTQRVLSANAALTTRRRNKAPPQVPNDNRYDPFRSDDTKYRGKDGKLYDIYATTRKSWVDGGRAHTDLQVGGRTRKESLYADRRTRSSSDPRKSLYDSLQNRQTSIPTYNDAEAKRYLAGVDQARKLQAISEQTDANRLHETAMDAHRRVLTSQIGPVNAAPLGFSTEQHYEAPRWHERTIRSGGVDHQLIEIDMLSYVGRWTIDPPAPAVDDFNIFALRVNPMNADLFPSFINELAKNFMYYRVRRSEVIVNPKTAPEDRGQLLYAYQADPTAPYPTNERDFLNIAGSESVTAWKVDQDFRPKHFTQVKWLSTGKGFSLDDNDETLLQGGDVDPPTDADPRLEDSGVLLFGADAFSLGSVTNVAGIRYRWHLELLGLKVVNSHPNCAIILKNPTTQLDCSEAFWASTPGNLSVRVIDGSDARVAVNGFCTIFSRPGQYRIDFTILGTGLGALYTNHVTNPGLAYLGTPNRVAYADNNGAANWNVSDTQLKQTMWVDIQDTDEAPVFGLFATPTTLTSVRLEISAVTPGSFVTGAGGTLSAPTVLEPFWFSTNSADVSHLA